MNLFFIHTPLQLMIAQNIIVQENLKDNIMLYGYVKGNSHFLNSYSMMACDKLWDKKIRFDEISSWAEFHQMKSYGRDFMRNLRNFKKLKDIIKKNKITAVYLSDMNNASYKLTACWMHRIGIKVIYFEEGSSHYTFVRNPYIHDDLKSSLISCIMDLSFFLPLFHFCWARYLKCKDFKINKLPMDIRYSLRPFYHEKIDRIVSCQKVIAPQLERYINNECHNLNTENSVLFMTSPIYQILVTDDSEYIDVMKQYFLTLAKDTNLVLKFHPRESENVKKQLMDFLDSIHITYCILSMDVAIPVEYYLQFYKFKEIVSFYTSTSFYNGYLFPKVKFIYLVDEYCNLCVKHGKTDLSRLADVIEMVDKLKKYN